VPELCTVIQFSVRNTLSVPEDGVRYTETCRRSMVKGKAIPFQARTDPEVSRRFVRSFRGADCDIDRYLVVAKFRDRLAVSKQAT